ncbi:MAG: hypothetical protein KatS3mg054_0356 [Chloroflexus sp.]|nr:MAG: hypothetical protein KatS3mg054_0356 [Chloroflexus sp.]
MATRNVVPTIDLRTEKEKMNEAFGYETMNRAEWHGKRSGYAKAVNGFSLYKMSNGRYNWYPFGHVPNIDGQVDHKAKLLHSWYYSDGTWKKI